MKINNTSVRGIYMYDPNVEFEYGDFVAQGDNIYIARPAKGDTVMGINPAEDTENFVLYLSDRTASLDYSLGYLDGEAGFSNDMYVSSYFLQGILNQFLIGFDEKGIITDYIDLREGAITTTERYTDLVDGLRDASSIFDKLATALDLNNAYLKIGRSFIAEDTNLGILSQIIGKGTGEYILLRQYTYRESGKTVRVQEIVDPSQAYVIYRRIVIGSDGSIIESSPFTSSFYDDQNINKVVQECITWANNLSEEYASKYESLRGSFRYRSLETELESIIPLTPEDFGMTSWEEDKIFLTVVTSEINGDSRRNNSITFDLCEVLGEEGDEEGVKSINYYITDTTFITATKTNQGISLFANGPRNSNFKIINIYYREVYNG